MIKPYDGKYLIVNVDVKIRDYATILYISEAIIPSVHIDTLECELMQSAIHIDDFDLFNNSGNYTFAITLCDDSDGEPDPYWEFTKLRFKPPNLALNGCLL